MVRKLNLLMFILLVSGRLGFAKIDDKETLLTFEEKAHLFIADEIFQAIIPALRESWNSLLSALEHGDLENPEYPSQGFWNDILLQRLKPYHNSIRDIDNAILQNKPSTVLNNAVNVADIPTAFNLSERCAKDKNADWMEVVKDGWIKVAGMMVQLHFKYDWTFDNIYSEGLSEHGEELESLNDSLKQYFPWYNIRDLDLEPEQKSTIDLVTISKQMASGELLQGKNRTKNLFHGLKQLLGQEGKAVLQSSEQPQAASTCTGDETIAGKRESVFQYVPVYVLLHLLNGEFKYFIMQNVAEMYRCIQSKKCDKNVSISSENHLQIFYKFYYNGIVDAFKEKRGESPLPSSVPQPSWRWKCDPKGQPETRPSNHIEDVTYTRFYDYQTVFVADEKEISLTKTCRDSCDLFDGGYSSIPCENDDWNCLEGDKYFDCSELRRQGLPCPGKTRTLCPGGAIKCTTSKMKEVQICEGQRDHRYIQWVDRRDGKFLGKKTACSSTGLKNVSTTAISENAAMTKFELENCELCVCKCYEPLSNRSHRYISLDPQITDIANQKALVGIKFIKIDGVIYPKIAQASVKYGIPNASSVEWMEPISITDISDSTKIFRLGRNAKNILLDDILAPVGYAITGVRFVAVNYSVKSDYMRESGPKVHTIFPVFESGDEAESWSYKSLEYELALAVQITALTELGDLQPETAIWKSNVRNTSLARKQVLFGDPDEPTLTDLPSVINSTSNQFISVQSTSINKDAGQTPIPFFDAQELIEPNNLTLLRGLGLFYKARTGYGGFLGFRTLSMPISDVPANPTHDLWHSKKF